MPIRFETPDTNAERVRLYGLLSLKRMRHEYQLVLLGDDARLDTLPTSLVNDLFTNDRLKMAKRIIDRAFEDTYAKSFAQIFKPLNVIPASDRSNSGMYYSQPEDPRVQLPAFNRQLEAIYNTHAESYITTRATHPQLKGELETTLVVHRTINILGAYCYLLQQPEGFASVWVESAVRDKAISTLEAFHTRLMRFEQACKELSDTK